MGSFEDNIARLEQATTEVREVVAEAHAVLKDMRSERREIERLLGTHAAQLVENRLNGLVKEGMDELGRMLRETSDGIYEKVGQQVDKLINLALGPENAIGHRRENLRPKLALMLQQWVRDEIGA